MLKLLLFGTAALAAPSIAVAQPAAQAAAPVIEDVWQVPANSSLSSVLSSWAERAHWTVIWEADSDYRLTAAGELRGDFPTAATRLITAFGKGRPRLRATLYEGNHVLRVWSERAEP